MAVKRFCERDCVGVFCRGDPLLRALTMASQAQRLLFMVEASPSTCEWSVIFRKQKFQLLPSYAAVRIQKLGASAVRPGGASARSRAGDA